ncbi:GNAT family N-acetyltransferase [Saccharopolyspora sp. NPDC047091]|uniref:GNAT family N-acetyltransferase n=1 Tax=Saccharopolyspora sp. NPDC047091 TaxID=3155924 RepID=UPI0034091102
MVEVVLLEADVDGGLVDAVAELLGAQVRAGAALGWVEPPPRAEIAELIGSLVAAGPGEAACAVARDAGELVGFGYWRRYARPTHRPHADLEKLAVSPAAGGRGIGRALLRALVESARAAGVEQLTLDFRGDNHAAEHLYRSEGFVECGRLPGFVAPADGTRHDKVLHVKDLRGPTG